MADANRPGDGPQDDVPGLNRPWDAEALPPPPPPLTDWGQGAPPPPPPPTRDRNQEPRSPEDIRTWAVLAHASAFIAAFFALAFLGPLVVWLLRKDIDEISALHAKEALNFNLTVLIYIAVSAFMVLFVIGLPMLLATGVFWFVNIVRAIMKVANGETFAYPFTIRFF